MRGVNINITRSEQLAALLPPHMVKEFTDVEWEYVWQLVCERYQEEAFSESALRIFNMEDLRSMVGGICVSTDPIQFLRDHGLHVTISDIERDVEQDMLEYEEPKDQTNPDIKRDRMHQAALNFMRKSRAPICVFKIICPVNADAKYIGYILD